MLLIRNGCTFAGNSKKWQTRNANLFCSLRGPFKNMWLGLIQLHFYTVSLHGHSKLPAHFSGTRQPDANTHGFTGLANNHNLHQLTEMNIYSYKTKLCINHFYNIKENTS